MNQDKKIIIATCALPYANGSIHLGHMLEHIQADIWVRYQRMRGNQVYFICADDAHGTPIMLKAQQLGIDPEKLIEIISFEHQSDLARFSISYDNYYSTHSEENRQLLTLIYQRLKRNGYIKNKTISQLFDPKRNIFLPDRFVIGNCPKCNSSNQYGDNCENCGATYSPTDLINPKSLISGVVPVIKKSEHFFFDLPAFRNFQNEWIKSGALQKQVANKTKEWLESGLRQWDISRDAPYFGFEIPDVPGKYFYVWLDAPIGYMSTFKNLCQKCDDLNFDDFWSVNSSADLYHFIGKDIIYFHSLFWPAILEGSQFRKPTNLFVHGHITINGAKMSKSRGTFIKARTYLKHLDAECLRYYYATKLSSRIDDIDLNLEDFVQRVNADIVNKVVNLASRSASFINKRFNNQLAATVIDQELYTTFANAATLIGNAFSNRETMYAVSEIISLANLANSYINKQTPWILAKQKKYEMDLHNVCSMGIHLFRVLIIYLKPILPSLAMRVEHFLDSKLTWDGIYTPLVSHKINQFKTLFDRVKMSQVQDMIEASFREFYELNNKSSK